MSIANVIPADHDIWHPRFAGLHAIAGTLQICSSAPSNLLDAAFRGIRNLGHAWLVFRPNHRILGWHAESPTRTTTYGTWGNSPNGTGGLRKGLFRNVEHRSTFIDVATRSVDITVQQFNQLQKLLRRFEQMGINGWNPLMPCSSFAAKAWYAATGERLNYRTVGGISTPAALRNSIENANRTLAAGTPPTNVKQVVKKTFGYMGGP